MCCILPHAAETSTQRVLIANTVMNVKTSSLKFASQYTIVVNNTASSAKPGI